MLERFFKIHEHTNLYSWSFLHQNLLIVCCMANTALDPECTGFFFQSLFIFERERERERRSMSGMGQRERARDTESEAGSRL